MTGAEQQSREPEGEQTPAFRTLRGPGAERPASLQRPEANPRYTCVTQNPLQTFSPDDCVAFYRAAQKERYGACAEALSFLLPLCVPQVLKGYVFDKASVVVDLENNPYISFSCEFNVPSPDRSPDKAPDTASKMLLRFHTRIYDTHECIGETHPREKQSTMPCYVLALVQDGRKFTLLDTNFEYAEGESFVEKRRLLLSTFEKIKIDGLLEREHTQEDKKFLKQVQSYCESPNDWCIDENLKKVLQDSKYKDKLQDPEIRALYIESAKTLLPPCHWPFAPKPAFAELLVKLTKAAGVDEVFVGKVLEKKQGIEDWVKEVFAKQNAQRRAGILHALREFHPPMLAEHLFSVVFRPPSGICTNEDLGAAFRALGPLLFPEPLRPMYRLPITEAPERELLPSLIANATLSAHGAARGARAGTQRAQNDLYFHALSALAETASEVNPVLEAEIRRELARFRGNGKVLSRAAIVLSSVLAGAGGGFALAEKGEAREAIVVQQGLDLRDVTSFVEETRAELGSDFRRDDLALNQVSALMSTLKNSVGSSPELQKAYEELLRLFIDILESQENAIKDKRIAPWSQEALPGKFVSPYFEGPFRTVNAWDVLRQSYLASRLDWSLGRKQKQEAGSVGDFASLLERASRSELFSNPYFDETLVAEINPVVHRLVQEIYKNNFLSSAYECFPFYSERVHPGEGVDSPALRSYAVFLYFEASEAGEDRLPPALLSFETSKMSVETSFPELWRTKLRHRAERWFSVLLEKLEIESLLPIAFCADLLPGTVTQRAAKLTGYVQSRDKHSSRKIFNLDFGPEPIDYFDGEELLNMASGKSGKAPDLLFTRIDFSFVEYRHELSYGSGAVKYKKEQGLNGWTSLREEAGFPSQDSNRDNFLIRYPY